MNIREHAISYIKTLSSEDKNKMKIMLEHNVLCCFGYTKTHNLDPVLFNQELKSILGGK